MKTDTSDPIVIDDAGIEVIGEDIYPPLVPELDDPVEDYIKALVAWIDEDPFQPLYQRQPVHDAVSGWDERLQNYFLAKTKDGTH